jgi:hypothetical protein
MAEELRPAPAWARQGGHTDLAAAVPAATAGSAIDRILVAERIARYGWCYDERDRAGLGGCFTEDGVWEGQIMGNEPVGPFRGRAAVVEFLTDFWAEQDDQRRHVFTNVVVDSIDGDHATAQAYLQLLASSEARTHTETAGPYRFEIARGEDDVWRLARLQAGFDAPF